MDRQSLSRSLIAVSGGRSCDCQWIFRHEPRIGKRCSGATNSAARQGCCHRKVASFIKRGRPNQGLYQGMSLLKNMYLTQCSVQSNLVPVGLCYHLNRQECALGNHPSSQPKKNESDSGLDNRIMATNSKTDNKGNMEAD